MRPKERRKSGEQDSVSGAARRHPMIAAPIVLTSPVFAVPDRKRLPEFALQTRL
jgi:hypothetical protein